MIDSYFLLENRTKISGKKHELQSWVSQYMKKNKRNTNKSSFPLISHGGKSSKTFKRAEITSDIQ